MSATIPENMRLDDLLKATGYDCPETLQGKTFKQATEGGGEEIHKIVVSDTLAPGTSRSLSFDSSRDDSNFQYITIGCNTFGFGQSSINKITREQILGASSGDKFSLTDGTLTLTLTITSAYEQEGVIFVQGSFTGSGYAVGTGSPRIVYVY